MKRAEHNTSNKSSGRGRAFLSVCVIAILLAAWLMLFRTRPVPADAVVRQSQENVNNIAGLYIKYRVTNLSLPGRQFTADIKMWSDGQGKMRVTTVQTGLAASTNVVTEHAVMTFDIGSDVAFLMPNFSAASKNNGWLRLPVEGVSPEGLLKNFGKGSKYAGSTTLKGKRCHVIIKALRNGYMKGFLDKQTGVLIQRDRFFRSKLVDRIEMVEMNIGLMLDPKMFSTQPPHGVMLIKCPRLIGLRNYAPQTPDRGAKSLDAAIYELEQISDQGKHSNATLTSIYAPEYIPDGFGFVSAGTLGESAVMPDGTQQLPHSAGYSSIYIAYINAKSGDSISVVQSNRKFDNVSKGTRRVSGIDGFYRTYQFPYLYTELFWSWDRYHFSICGSSLDIQQLVNIAKSMKPIRK